MCAFLPYRVSTGKVGNGSSAVAVRLQIVSKADSTPTGVASGRTKSAPKVMSGRRDCRDDGLQDRGEIAPAAAPICCAGNSRWRASRARGLAAMRPRCVT